MHQTPLHWSAKRNNLEISSILIQNGADFNARDIRHRTPLYIALKYNYFHIVKVHFKKLLIYEGASPFLKSMNGENLINISNDDRCINLIRKSRQVK